MATNSSKSGGSTDEIGKENGKSTFVPGAPGSTDFLSERPGIQRAVETGKTPLETAPPPPQNFYISLGRQGAWFDTDQDGVLDTGETLATVSDPDGDNDFQVVGVRMDIDTVTVRVVDGRTATPLDLTGFGEGDKIIIDASTNQNDFLGLREVFNNPSIGGPTDVITYRTTSALATNYVSLMRQVGGTAWYAGMGFTTRALGQVWGGWYTGPDFSTGTSFKLLVGVGNYGAYEVEFILPGG